MLQQILVAGNNLLVDREGRVLLKAKGYHLTNIDNLHDAVALALECPPDLLLVEKGFAGSGDKELIIAIKGCLHKVNIPIILVIAGHKAAIALDWDDYPVDDLLVKPFSIEALLTRIQLAAARMIRVFDNNPLSRLPGNTSILRAIERALAEKTPYAVGYIDIDNFKPYNDRYGFLRGDEVILMVARVTVNVVEEMARAGSFVGHIGGDDFVFIVREDKIEAVCQRILSNFDLVRNMFLNEDDLKAGEFVGKDRLNRETRFALLSLSIAVVILEKNKYKHYGAVSAAASEMKHCVKKLEGSNYMIERRDRLAGQL